VAVLAVLALLGIMAMAGATPRAPAPMAGLYNILVVPFASFPETDAQAQADALEHTLVRHLHRWAVDEPAVETSGRRRTPSSPPYCGFRPRAG